MTNDTFRMTPISFSALVGGIVAFIAVGAITAVLWVALGIALGAAVGFGITRLGEQLTRSSRG